MNGIASISSGGFRDFERTFKGAKVTHVQTGGGDTDGRFTYLAAPGLHLIRMVGAPPCIVTVEMDPDLILFSVPVSWQGRLTYDGERVTQTTFFRHSRNDAYFVRYHDRDVIAATLPRDEVIQGLAALRGTGPEDIEIGDGALELRETALNHLRLRLAWILNDAALHRSRLSDAEAVRNITDTVKTLILDHVLRATPNQTPYYQTRCSPSLLVRRAEERFLEAESDRLSLADLCDATGVGATALTAAFHSVCGVTPMRYFKLRRLSQVRSSLLRSKATRAAVKRAAIDAGFMELGRFSVDYRELFGQTPSATLSRASNSVFLR